MWAFATRDNSGRRKGIWHCLMDSIVFSKLQRFRNVAARYDKLAANDFAMFEIATLRIWPRANVSTPWSSS